MTEEQKRVKIAELCEWTYKGQEYSDPYWCHPEINEVYDTPPDYFHDLNAMNEAEKTLTQFERSLYRDLLPSPFPGEPSAYWHASATERAEAFGKVKGLWE